LIADILRNLTLLPHRAGHTTAAT